MKRYDHNIGVVFMNLMISATVMWLGIFAFLYMNLRYDVFHLPTVIVILFSMGSFIYFYFRYDKLHAKLFSKNENITIHGDGNTYIGGDKE